MSVQGAAAAGWTNTYVIVAGSPSLRNHLAMRDLLRANPVARAEYAAVKRQVGTAAADIDDYGRRKNTIVRRILEAAGPTDAERAAMDANLGALAYPVAPVAAGRSRFCTYPAGVNFVVRPDEGSPLKAHPSHHIGARAVLTMCPACGKRCTFSGTGLVEVNPEDGSARG